MGDPIARMNEKYKASLPTLDVEPEEVLIALALDAIPYEPERAKEGPCKCFEDFKGKELCWDKGMIGLLSQAQVQEFCPPENRERYKLPEKMQHRMETFGLASEECDYGNIYNGKPIDNLEARFHCMHKYASKNHALTDYPPRV